MSKARALGVLLLASACLMGPAAFLAVRSAAAAEPPPPVLSLRLTGVVDPFMESYVRRGISLANRDGDPAVLLTIDTPGGLDSSMRGIVQAILSSRAPVVCYVSPSGARAASAGAFIMMACPISAMAPGTNIGAAHPVGVSGVIEQQKVTNDAAAFIRSLADRWHRNATWAEQAVRSSISATAPTALNEHVVDLSSPSLSELLATIGGCSPGSSQQPATGLLASHGPLAGLCPPPPVEAFRMSVGEGLFHALADPNVAFLLINIGLIALIVWVFHPGLHVSLAVGIISLVVGFAILETLPVRLVGVILLAVSAVLFVLDVKAKAHGVLTAGGITTMVLGGLLLFNPSVPGARVSRPLLIVVSVGMGLFAAFVLRALVSARGHPVRTGMEALQGEPGVVTRTLEPRGLVRARNETWTAESALGDAIPRGAPVRVIRVRGVTLIVERDGAAVAGVRGDLGGTGGLKEGDRT